MGHMIAITWTNTANQRGRDAYDLLDHPMADRNPHDIGSNLKMVVTHVAVIASAVGMAIHLLKS